MVSITNKRFRTKDMWILLYVLFGDINGIWYQTHLRVSSLDAMYMQVNSYTCGVFLCVCL